MKEVIITQHILEQVEDALRLAANILGSRSRETCADRQIDYAERLVKWVKGGKVGPHPGYIPKENERL